VKPFDEGLYALKLQESSKRMQAEREVRRRRALFEQNQTGQGRGVGFLVKLVDCDLGVLRAYLADVDRVCREVWHSDGNTISPEFIRTVLVPHVFSVIAASKGGIEHHLELLAARTNIGVTHLKPSLQHLAHEIGLLGGEIATRSEIEAIELAKQMTQLPRVSEPLQPPEAVGGSSLSASGRKPTQMSPNAPASWREFRDEFEQLAREQERPVRTPKNRRDRRMMLRADGLLWASGNYKKHPEIWAEKGKPGQGFFCLLQVPETGLWMLDDGVSENLQARFRALASRAGVALGSPKDTDPEDFWLHRLYLDLRENNSEHLFCESDEGGMILHVCEASATFCSRLERSALEAAVLLPQHGSEDGKRRRIPLKVVKPPALGGRKAEDWTKLERRGEFIVLAEPSCDTTTQIRHDYALLKWNVRQFDQWVSQRKASEKQPTLKEAKAVFGGTILVGDADRVPYLTDHELAGLLAHSKTPSSFAEEILVKRWGFTAATVRTYLRRKPHGSGGKS
jgi:hypothetical protein